MREDRSVHVNISNKVFELLTYIAKKENTTISVLVNQLIMEAIEERDDFALSIAAELRDTATATTIPHEAAWI